MDNVTEMRVYIPRRPLLRNAEIKKKRPDMLRTEDYYGKSFHLFLSNREQQI